MYCTDSTADPGMPAYNDTGCNLTITLLKRCDVFESIVFLGK